MGSWIWLWQQWEIHWELSKCENYWIYIESDRSILDALMGVKRQMFSTLKSLIQIGHLSQHDKWRSVGHLGQFPRFVHIRSQWLYNLQKRWKETGGGWKKKELRFVKVELEMKSCRARLRSVKENEHNQNENLGHCITLKQIMVKAIMARPAVKWNEC